MSKPNRYVTTLCSLEFHGDCPTKPGGLQCSCSCHYTLVPAVSGHDFEERLWNLVVELNESNRQCTLTWKQTRRIMLKFYKAHQTDTPMDDEVDETTNAVQQFVQSDACRKCEWDDLYAARKVVSPTLF